MSKLREGQPDEILSQMPSIEDELEPSGDLSEPGRSSFSQEASGASAANRNTSPTQVRRMSHKMRSISYHLASGLSRKQIAEIFQITPERVSQIANSPLIIDEVRAIQSKHFGGSLEKRIKHLAPKATATLESVLDDEAAKHSDRLGAARYILDQTMGKPLQRHEIKTNLLSDFMDMLDQLPKKQLEQASSQNPLKDVVDTEASSAQPQDENVTKTPPPADSTIEPDIDQDSGEQNVDIDAWIEQHLTER